MATPETVTFNAMTAECGLSTFQFMDDLSFLRLEYDPLLHFYTVVVEPTSNQEEGTYPVTLEKKLVDYPEIVVPNSVFEITIVPTINQPPVFTEELNVFHVVFKLTEGSEAEDPTWTYALPAAIDPDGDTFVIEVVESSAAMAFVSLDAAKGELSIADLASDDVSIGQYVIKVQLNDGEDVN